MRPERDTRAEQTADLLIIALWIGAAICLVWVVSRVALYFWRS